MLKDSINVNYKNDKKKSNIYKYQHKDFIFSKKFDNYFYSDSINTEQGYSTWDFFTFLNFKKSGKNLIDKFKKEKIFGYGYDYISDDLGNPLCNLDIFSLVIKNTKKMEKKFMPDVDYINYQPDINKKMRSILIDWLIDVHNKFKLVSKTLFLTVNIIDRFLTIKSISRQKLQLLGISAMLIASKYEEIYAPETRDFVYITDSAYTKEDIFRMENLICETLKYDFSSPSLLNILVYNMKRNQENKSTICLSWYCAEITLLEYYILKYPPSLVAFVIILFVKKILNKYCKIKNYEFSFMLEKNFNDIDNNIENCENLIKANIILSQNEKHKLTASKRKYCAKKYAEISNAKYSIYFA
nr:cyclin B [Cryptomonas curvata]